MVLLIFITIFYGKLSFYTKKGITVVIPFLCTLKYKYNLRFCLFPQLGIYNLYIGLFLRCKTLL